MAKTSIIIPLFCVYIIYSDMHRVNASPWTYISSISPLSHTFVKGDLWVTVTARTCRYHLMSLLLMYFQKVCAKLKIIYPVM